MINWNVTEEDWVNIIAVAERVESDLKPTDDRRTIVLDLTACHANGCPLLLKQMIDGPLFDFSHDYYGIRKHINRKTGKLEDCFVPRFAAPEPEAQSVSNLD